MARALLLLTLGAAACRPQSHGEDIRIVVPVEDVAPQTWRPLRLDVTLAIPPDAVQRGSRPARSTTIEVPADEPLPPRMKG